MRRLLLVFLVLAAFPFAVLTLDSGCSAQGEGQLCSTFNNTNDDCAAGLVCTVKIGYSACCPPSGSTQPACTGNGNGNGGATTTTTSSTSGTDAGTDGSTDGGSDAATDGATDGGSDAGSDAETDASMLDGGDGG